MQNSPKGLSDLPGIVIIISTTDAEKEPALVTANTIISTLAVDYPVEKVASYLSDDGGSLVTFKALAEAAKLRQYMGSFLARQKVKREYDEFKVGITTWFSSM
ncbi:hypothetical protein L2E82_13125 [Cichorium intybus]|uniref:Uncharacterized protein n=1 Tax=Cichorium intybus TaxID=13427 RepID=A0ACB9GJ33_CICIN|nr:hypothetical protein L2E82_13125 [Cichorium intybus]